MYSLIRNHTSHSRYVMEKSFGTNWSTNLTRRRQKSRRSAGWHTILLHSRSCPILKRLTSGMHSNHAGSMACSYPRSHSTGSGSIRMPTASSNSATCLNTNAAPYAGGDSAPRARSIWKSPGYTMSRSPGIPSTVALTPNWTNFSSSIIQ